MGVYLNSKKPCTVYKKIAQSVYFIDKTAMLGELIPIVAQVGEEAGMMQAGGKDLRYICITRPRRFGKTVMADMVSSFFGKGEDSRSVFEKLVISHHKDFEKHLNKHNVIHIAFNEIPKNCKTYEQYINRIEEKLVRDLLQNFPGLDIREDEAVWDILNDLYESKDSAEFVFVFDEWDFIYHQDFIFDEDKKKFARFLSVLLKDQPYVEMVYMTGILPISKYSSGSELNMFMEYSITTREKYSDYFGFTDKEVDVLYQRYLDIQKYSQKISKVTRKGLKLWYDGYQTLSGKKLYNPRSVDS